MNLLQGALRKPITVLVAVIAIIFFSVLSIRQHEGGHFPDVRPAYHLCGAAVWRDSHPTRWKGLITSYYEYHFLYVTGVKFCRIQIHTG